MTADASKIDRRSLSVISDLVGTQRLLTANRIDRDVLRKIRRSGIEAVVIEGMGTNARRLFVE